VKTLVRIFLIASFPLLLLLGWVRIMLLPAFIEWEYRRPGFPPDPYGFTVEERIRWAHVSRRYLLTDEDEEFFSEYRLADGSPLYNERELRHMVDVRLLVSTGMQILVVLGMLYAAGCAYLFRKDRPALRRTLAAAGVATFGLWILILAVVALAWNRMFVLFHEVFFTGETWLFPYTDTLIRLFPVAFWQDGFALAVVGMLATCLLAWFGASVVPALWKRRWKRTDG
jgi:integral membrane protein (TIGR01906 family)